MGATCPLDLAAQNKTPPLAREDNRHEGLVRTMAPALNSPRFEALTALRASWTRTREGRPDAANAITGLTHRAIADGSRPGGAIRVKSLPDGMVESGAGENAAMVAGGRPGSTTTRVPTLMRP